MRLFNLAFFILAIPSYANEKSLLELTSKDLRENKYSVGISYQKPADGGFDYTVYTSTFEKLPTIYIELKDMEKYKALIKSKGPNLSKADRAAISGCSLDFTSVDPKTLGKTVQLEQLIDAEETFKIKWINGLNNSKFRSLGLENTKTKNILFIRCTNVDPRLSTAELLKYLSNILNDHGLKFSIPSTIQAMDAPPKFTDPTGTRPKALSSDSNMIDLIKAAQENPGDHGEKDQ